MIINPNDFSMPLIVGDVINPEKFYFPWNIRKSFNYIFEGSIKISSSEPQSKRYTIGYALKRSMVPNFLDEFIKKNMFLSKSTESYILNNLETKNTLWFGSAEKDGEIYNKIYLDNNVMVMADEPVKGYDIHKKSERIKNYKYYENLSIAETSIFVNLGDKFIKNFISKNFNTNKNKKIILINGRNRESILIPLRDKLNRYPSFGSSKIEYAEIFDYFNQKKLYEEFFLNDNIFYYYPSYIQIGLENANCFFFLIL